MFLEIIVFYFVFINYILVGFVKLNKVILYVIVSKGSKIKV